MKRKTIIVDLDNVVYDFVGAFAQWLSINQALPKNWDTKTAMAAYSQWDIWDDWHMTKGEFKRWWRLGIEHPYLYKYGPVIDGARDALWQLSDAEWHIHLVTNRLSDFGLHDTIVDNTSSWLREHNIPYRSLSFAADKHAIQADAIVDDRADNMSATSHASRFMFGAPHNKGQITWKHITNLLLVEEWQRDEA